MPICCLMKYHWSVPPITQGFFLSTWRILLSTLHHILILLIEFRATIVDDVLPLFWLPDAYPHTLDFSLAAKRVALFLRASHRRTTIHASNSIVLIEHCIRSLRTVSSSFINVAEDILISGNTLHIHVELHRKHGFALDNIYSLHTITHACPFETSAL